MPIADCHPAAWSSVSFRPSCSVGEHTSTVSCSSAQAQGTSQASPYNVFGGAQFACVRADQRRIARSDPISRPQVHLLQHTKYLFADRHEYRAGKRNRKASLLYPLDPLLGK